jgi:hypothetical protein
MEGRKADLSDQGTDTQQCPGSAPSIRGSAPCGHGADDMRAFRNVSRRSSRSSAAGRVHGAAPSVRLTASAAGRYADGVKRLELAGIRVCSRCGRGGAELRSGDGDQLVVPLDPVRARQLAGTEPTDDLRSLTEFVLERLDSRQLGEVVLDVAHGRLCALLSLMRDDDESEVVACTAEEGVALAIRGSLRLYATDDALAHGAASKAARHGGPDTVH